MKYAIIYASHGGNTKQLAMHIQNTFHGECVYIGEPQQVEADIIFVGSWTDKGTCDEKVKDYLTTLHNQKVFLFGTAGFGGSSQYFNQIIQRFSKNLDDSNDVIGSFMCQGKMPLPIRERYVQLAIKDPQKFEPMIENFDKALEHPNQSDLDNFTNLLNAI